MSDPYFNPLGTPTIYAYTTPHYAYTPWEGAKTGKGLLKVGYTQGSVVERVRQQFPVIQPEAQPFTILVTESAMAEDGKFFTDKRIHSILTQRGFRHVSGEWFECTAADVQAAIHQARTGLVFKEGQYLTFAMRPEQAQAVKQTADYFGKYAADTDGRAAHYLWNAKMRFGKTFTAYQLARAMGWKRILVLTYKPAVESAWREDLESHVDFERWQFIGRGETLDKQDEARPIVWFASFQDILGKTKTGQIKDRFELAHATDWDCVILDEYHFGSWREAARDLYDADMSEKASIEKEEVEFSEETFPLHVRHFLYLTGTPFRALTTGEFLEDQIFSWTYADEQRAKENWDDTKGPSPYLELPQMILMTYQMPEEIRDIALRGENNEFDLNEFFKAKETAGTGLLEQTQCVFEHESEVQKWLHLIRGNHMAANPTAGTDAVTPPIPFEDVRLQAYLQHTFWFLPSVAACKAMARLLYQPQNAFYHDYHVVVAAGIEAGIGMAALGPVKEAIGNPLRTKSITLSCGKLTTGVTVPAWTGIFMLRNTSSPETYFQSAFRVQSPWVVRNQDGKDPHSIAVIKPQCYIFDFAPNRALQQISEYSGRLDLNEGVTAEAKVSEFIHFLPVLCYDGYSMKMLDAGELLDIVAAGTASTMLAKRWQSAQMVNVDNITLERLLNNPDVLAALENIEAFRNLSKDISRVIASEKALNNVKKEKNATGEGPDKKDKEQEKENQGFKKKLREKLLKFVTRVPVFMYLTDHREEALKDVITNIEPQLFTKVTGLQVSDFEKLCEVGVFNPPVMNSAIFAFKRFEEASLTYAGGRNLSAEVGGFDMVIPRSELPQVIEGLS